jgi:L-2-hydroxyglutarate oxidase
LRDAAATFSYPGFWRMAAKHWQNGVAEVYRSLNKSAFVRSMQTLVPEIQDADVVADGSGVRAQALRPDGALVDDFHFVSSQNVVHVLNVPSPAATASLPIGREIAHLAQQAFRL